MGKNLVKTTTFRFTDQSILQKLDVIAALHKRKRNQQVEWILSEFIKDYEKQNGKIILKDDLEHIPPQVLKDTGQQEQQLIASTKGHIKIPETQKKTTETSAV